MIEFLLILNLILLFLVYRLLMEKVGRIISVFYGVYTGAFVVLKPALAYYAGILYPFSTNSPEAMTRLLVGSLIFLVVQWWGVRFFTDKLPHTSVLRWFDFDHADARGVTLAFLALMALSYLACVIKFGSATYLFHYLDTFAATMAVANGSFYLNILSEILVYGLLMVVGRNYWKYPASRSFLMLIGMLLITFLWTKMANRTTILVAILAWVACAMSFKRQRDMGLFRFGLLGYFLLILLYVVNYFRLGQISSVSSGSIAFGAFTGALADLVPVDDALLLYGTIDSHQLTHFIYLLGAITPLLLLPSALVPFKPRLDKDSTLTDIFFPHGADQTFFHEGSTLTFTIPASGYADAWFLGTFVASVVYVALFCFYVKIFRYGSRSARYIAAFWLMIFVAAYRLSVEAALMTFYSSVAFIAATRWMALALSENGRQSDAAPQILPRTPV